MRAVSKERNPRFVWAVVTLYFVYLLSVDMTAIAVDCGARLTREAGMGSAVLERIIVLLYFSNVMPGLQTLWPAFQYFFFPYEVYSFVFLFLYRSWKKAGIRRPCQKYFKARNSTVKRVSCGWFMLGSEMRRCGKAVKC